MRNVTTILTLGYERRDLSAYIAILQRHNVSVVVDVRETAWSHKPGFSKSALQEGLRLAGIGYIHAKIVGNPKRLRRLASSHEECLCSYRDLLDEKPEMEMGFDEIIREALLREQRVCLMCFERHPDDCHRGILAERWAARYDCEIKHLEPEGCRRLIGPAELVA